MSKREVYKRAYLKGIRDITVFVSITILFTAMFVVAIIK